MEKPSLQEYIVQILRQADGNGIEMITGYNPTTEMVYVGLALQEEDGYRITGEEMPFHVNELSSLSEISVAEHSTLELDNIKLNKIKIVG